MSVKAHITKQFTWRLALISAVCFGISMWFLYDGMVAWPRQNQQAEAQGALEYHELIKEKRLDEWPALAEENGWPEEGPELKWREPAEIIAQRVISAIIALPAILYAFFFFRDRRRWVEMTDTGLQSSWGKQLKFDQIELLNKKKWKAKGIAKVVYRQNGRKGVFVLDDWKYDTEPTRTMLREVESRIDPEQIVGGFPEPTDEEQSVDEQSPTDEQQPPDDSAEQLE